LKEEALDRTMWKARFGRGFGPVVRQTTKWMSITGYSNMWWRKFLMNFQPSRSFSFCSRNGTGIA
jgi:hypothetical protein